MSKLFPVITICGSMRYFKAMLAIARSLTTQGQIVLMPFNADYVAGKPADEIKRMLDRMHRVKIDMSQAIVVVGSHIGLSTSMEINYARDQGKAIIYYEQVDHLL